MADWLEIADSVGSVVSAVVSVLSLVVAVGSSTRQIGSSQESKPPPECENAAATSPAREAHMARTASLDESPADDGQEGSGERNSAVVAIVDSGPAVPPPVGRGRWRRRFAAWLAHPLVSPVMLAMAHVTWLGRTANGRIQEHPSRAPEMADYWEWTTSRPALVVGAALGAGLFLYLVALAGDPLHRVGIPGEIIGVILFALSVVVWYSYINAMALFVVVDLFIVFIQPLL